MGSVIKTLGHAGYINIHSFYSKYKFRKDLSCLELFKGDIFICLGIYLGVSKDLKGISFHRRV